MTTLRIVDIPNILYPARRIVEDREVGPLVCPADLIGERDPQAVVVWLNGKRIDVSKPFGPKKKDVLVIGTTPGVLAIAALPWWQALLVTGAILSVGALVTNQLLGVQDEPQDPEDGGTGGFSGFRNSYESGGAVPVVYGRHRVAGPVIYQQIGSAIGSNALSDVEELIAIQAVSEGPIRGFGKFLGPVATEADVADAKLNAGGAAADNAGVQINGQLASNFTSVTIDWRTGEINQDAYAGTEGAVDTTIIEQSLPYSPGIGAAVFPSGAYSAGTDITTATPGGEIGVQSTQEYDRAVVQFEFPSGLFSADQGSIGQTLAEFRIQYYETDAGGTQIADTIILPTVFVAGSTQGGLVFDVPINFASTANYQPLQQVGYATCRAASTEYVQIQSTIDAALFPDNFADKTQVKFSVQSWIRPNNMTGAGSGSGANNWIWVHSNQIPANQFAQPYSPSGSATSATGFGMRIVNYDNSQVRLVFMSWGSNSAGINIWITPHLGLTTAIQNNWHHVGVTYDATKPGAEQVDFYFNGVKLAGALASTYDANARGNFGTASDVYLGRSGTVGAGTTTDSTNIDIATWGLYTGIRPDDFFTEKFSALDVLYNVPIGVVNTDDVDLRAGFNAIVLTSSTFILNKAPGFTTSTATGEAFELVGGNFTNAPAFSTPVYEPEIATFNKGYYKIEVFRSDIPIADSQDGQDEARVSQISFIESEEYEYPGTATLKTRIVADDQVSSERPTITSIVYGRLVPVWDGASLEFPTFNDTWTRNPAWIARDAATNKRYGLGYVFDKIEGIDLAKFAEWADFCDEGVEDGYGDLTFFGGSVTAATTGFPDGYVTIKVPILDQNSDPTGNSIPPNWVVGYTLGIKAAASIALPGFAGSWLTTPSNVKLEIFSLSYKENTSATDFVFWCEIILKWTPKLPLPNVTGDVTGTVVGFESRCHFDGVFSTADADAWEELIKIFQAGRAMPILVGNKLSVFINKPRPVTAMFTMANIIKGSLNLDWTGAKDNPNALEVDFQDELANYERVPLERHHPSVQDETSFEDLRSQKFAMPGVVRRTQAIRDADFRLATLNELLRRARFKASIDSVPVLPGDRCWVAHETPQYGQSGRLLGVDDEFGNLNLFPEDFVTHLLQNGGGLDVSGPTVLVADLPISASANGTYQETGPFGYGDADLIRNTARGSGQDNPLTTDTYNSGDGLAALEFYDSALLPPTAVPLYLGVIESTSWEITVSVFVKEPDTAASDQIRLQIYFPTDASGAALDEEYSARFQWVAGVLQTVGTPTNGSTSQVQAPGTTGASAGWYRASISIRYADIPGGFSMDVGDPYQVRLEHCHQGGLAAGAFSSGNDSGKGINFLEWGDPLDFNQWTTQTDVGIADQTIVVPPFYADQTHGTVQLLTSTIATGTSALIEETSSIQGAGSTFGGSGTVTNEDFTATLYLRNNNATNTRVVFGNGSGNNVTVDIDWTGPTLTTAGSAGASASIAAVSQNSSTTDPDWYEFTCTFNNAAGDNTTTLRILPEYAASATGKGVYVWGVRVHGDSDNGTNANPYPHRGVFAWGLDVQPSYTIADYAPGEKIALDQDVVFEAGKSYEVEVRSSFVQAEGGGAVVDSVPIDPSEVPGAGSTTVTAGTLIQTQKPFTGFQPRPGDIYSIGEVGVSYLDSTVVDVDFDPVARERTISVVEYKNSVFDAVAVGAAVQSLSTFATATVPEATYDATPNDIFGGSYPQADDASFFSDNGEVVFAAKASWQINPAVRGRSFGGVDLYVSKLTDGAPGPLEYAGRASTRVRSFRITEYPFVPGTDYRVYLRPVNRNGIGRAAKASPYANFTFYGATPSLTAPDVETGGVRGERNLIRIEPGALSSSTFRASEFEGRVGGWRLGQRITNLTRGQNDLTDEIFTGPTNSAGQGAPSIFIRGKKGRGGLGRAASVVQSEQILGATLLTEIAFEDDWTDGGSATLVNLQENADGYLEFSASDTSGTWTSATKQLSYARRVYMELWAEGDVVPEQQLQDLYGTQLGSRRFMHWTLEGPISGPEESGSRLQIQWDYSEDLTLSGDFREFRPGVVYLRAAQFRIGCRRFTTNSFLDQFEIRRFGFRAWELPSWRSDGGTF